MKWKKQVPSSAREESVLLGEVSTHVIIRNDCNLHVYYHDMKGSGLQRVETETTC